MARKDFQYLPFGRKLRDAVAEYFGEDNTKNRKRAARLLGVNEVTFSCGWCLGHTRPRLIEDRLKLGVFMGMMKDGNDKEGERKTLEFFDSCESTPEERAMALRYRKRKGEVRKYRERRLYYLRRKGQGNADKEG